MQSYISHWTTIKACCNCSSLMHISSSIIIRNT